jgi:hypothetical protein
MSPAKLAQATAFSLCFFLQFLPPIAAAQNCDGKLAPGDLRRCEEMFTRQVESGSRTSQLPGGWRLVRTPDPRSGKDTVSALHTADTEKSDVNFAGLTFRCGPAGIETLLVLITPLVRGSAYAVRAKAGSAETRFEAKALQGGEVLLLPPTATLLANGAWQTASELSVDIEAPSPIHGTVPLNGLSGAISALSQSCPAR